MNLIMISNIVTCVCAFVGFVYGSIRFLKPRTAVYPQMITLAVGCMAFGRLYQVVRLLTGGDVAGEFQLGVFGVIGSLLFLFSANFGSIDSLVDDKSAEFKKYRLIALAAPMAVGLLYALFIVLTDVPLFAKILSAVITVFAMQASYFHLKHLIFPDVDFGVISCLKQYNLLALLYCFLCVAEMIVIGINNGVLLLITDIIIGALLIGVVFSVERGIKKWTT